MYSYENSSLPTYDIILSRDDYVLNQQQYAFLYSMTDEPSILFLFPLKINSIVNVDCVLLHNKNNL